MYMYIRINRRFYLCSLCFEYLQESDAPPTKKQRTGNPQVYLDVKVGNSTGRIVIDLRADVVPKTAGTCIASFITNTKISFKCSPHLTYWDFKWIKHFIRHSSALYCPCFSINDIFYFWQRISDVCVHMRKVLVTKEVHFTESYHNLYPFVTNSDTSMRLY